MGGATFTRSKTFITGEVLYATDVNGIETNILNNLNPSGVDDYSETLTQMRTVTDPYPLSVISQATSLAGEIERLRYQINQMKGGTYWYEDVPTSLNTAPFVGAVLWSASTTVPTGWLECDGAAISRTTYAALFTCIGTTFGVGDGSTTFNLPDLRDDFIRGWDHGRGFDSGRVFGSFQADELKSHYHSITMDSGTGGTGTNHHSLTYTDNTSQFSETSDLTGGTETRPRNTALMAVIKY